MKIGINRHAPEYLVVIAGLLPLLRRYPPFAELDFDDLCDHLARYWNKGTMCYVFNDWGEPRAVCLIKLFKRLEQFLTPYAHDPDGQFVMIEMMVADDPIAMGRICEELVKRFGVREIVMWDRGERTEGKAPRIYKWDDFMKLARRISYGTIAMERI